MYWKGRRAAIRVAELLVRTALSCLFETKGDEDRDYLTGFEDGNSRQRDQATTTV